MNRLKLYFYLKYKAYKSCFFLKEFRIFQNIRLRNGITFNTRTSFEIGDNKTYHINEDNIYLTSKTGNNISLDINVNDFIELHEQYQQADFEEYDRFRLKRGKLINNDLKSFRDKNYNKEIVDSELERWRDNGFELYTPQFDNILNSTECVLDKRLPLYVKEEYRSHYKNVHINGLYLKLVMSNYQDFITNFDTIMSDIKYTISTLEDAMPNYKFNYQIDIFGNCVNLLFFSTFKSQNYQIESIVISTITKEESVIELMEATANKVSEEFLLQIKNAICN